MFLSHSDLVEFLQIPKILLICWWIFYVPETNLEEREYNRKVKVSLMTWVLNPAVLGPSSRPKKRPLTPKLEELLQQDLPIQVKLIRYWQIYRWKWWFLWSWQRNLRNCGGFHNMVITLGRQLFIFLSFTLQATLW